MMIEPKQRLYSEFLEISKEVAQYSAACFVPTKWIQKGVLIGIRWQEAERDEETINRLQEQPRCPKCGKTHPIIQREDCGPLDEFGTQEVFLQCKGCGTASDRHEIRYFMSGWKRTFPHYDQDIVRLLSTWSGTKE